MPVGLEELLHCGKCHLKYDLAANRPKLLVCHHCFCMQCVQTFIKTKNNQTATCPTCKKVTCIARNGVSALPDNEYLLPQLYHLHIEAKQKPINNNNNIVNITKPIEPIEPEVFVSDESEEEQYEDNNGDFISDEYDEYGDYGGAGEAIGGATFFNGAIAAQTGKSLNNEVRIFCETCLSLAIPSCLATHQICNYDNGVKDLQSRLHGAVQQAGDNLVGEIHLLEANSKQLGNVQHSWTAISQTLDQNAMSQTEALSAAKALLEKLPDPKLGAQSAKIGDPTTLSRAVIETETLLANSAARLKQTKLKSSIWNSVTTCKMSVHSVELNKEVLSLALELNDKSKEETICLLYSLSKVMENKYQNLTISTPVSSPSSSSSRSATPPVVTEHKPKFEKPKINGHQPTMEWTPSNRKFINKPEKNPNDFEPVTNKKIQRPLSSNCAHCFFDLVQGTAELGRVMMEVNCRAAPKMAQNFIDLCTGSHGFGYFNSKLWKISSGDHIDGGDISEGGQCSIFDKKPFLGDASTLQDSVGALRMRGRGTSEDGQPIVGAQFMIWVKERKFKNYTRTLVFGRVIDGLEILSNMPETRQRKGKPFVPPVTIIRCGVLE